MFSFAKSLVKTIEQSAESIINNSNNNNNDPYFESASTNFGFRVLNVNENAHESVKQLEPWFDYIVGVNQHQLLSNNNDPTVDPANKMPDYSLFIQELQNCTGKSISLMVWNAKGGCLRELYITVEPFEQLLDGDSTIRYNSEGYLYDDEKKVLTNNKFKTLGFSIQATSLITATYVYHVLEIQPNSPAEKCGLIPNSDYIIGANDGLFATGGEALFGRVINSIFDRNGPNTVIDLFVYNHDYDVVRPVKIYPNNAWGGNGVLGCGVGYGFLHRLPSVIGKFDTGNSQFLNAPGTTLFNMGPDSLNASQDIITPAHIPAPPHIGTISSPPTQQQIAENPMASMTVPPPISKKKKHVSHAAAATHQFDDYFKQESERSAKLDTKANVPVSADLPPPPK